MSERPAVSVLAGPAGTSSPGGRPVVPAAVVRLAVVVVAGVVAGVVWWWLAPTARTDVEQGSVYLRGHAELQAAQDCWFAIVLGALGVVTATVHAW